MRTFRRPLPRGLAAIRAGGIKTGVAVVCTCLSPTEGRMARRILSRKRLVFVAQVRHRHSN